MDFVQKTFEHQGPGENQSNIAHWTCEVILVTGQSIVLGDQTIVTLIKMLRHGFQGSVPSSISKSIMMRDKNQTEI